MEIVTGLSNLLVWHVAIMVLPLIWQSVQLKCLWLIASSKCMLARICSRQPITDSNIVHTFTLTTSACVSVKTSQFLPQFLAKNRFRSTELSSGLSSIRSTWTCWNRSRGCHEEDWKAGAWAGRVGAIQLGEKKAPGWRWDWIPEGSL